MASCIDLALALQKLAHNMRSFSEFSTAVIGREPEQPSAKEKNEYFNQKGLNSNVWQLFIPDLNW